MAWLRARAVDLALPAACAGCASEGTVLCDRCSRALDVRLSLPPGTPLGLPRTMPMPLAQLEWCAPFSGVVRTCLHRLKYAGERRLAVPLGAALARRWAAVGCGDLLVPVPIHAERLRRRGYDQSALLAAAAAERLGMPWLGALARARATCPQFDLGRTARWSNVSGAFTLSDPRVRRSVAGRWIVLVDDVVTTGATLVACAETLLDAGAGAVSALTVARER